jgi:membrane-bound lytic murein transglycosylase D
MPSKHFTFKRCASLLYIAVSAALVSSTAFAQSPSLPDTPTPTEPTASASVSGAQPSLPSSPVPAALTAPVTATVPATPAIAPPAASAASAPVIEAAAAVKPATVAPVTAPTPAAVPAVAPIVMPAVVSTTPARTEPEKVLNDVTGSAKPATPAVEVATPAPVSVSAPISETSASTTSSTAPLVERIETSTAPQITNVPAPAPNAASVNYTSTTETSTLVVADAPPPADLWDRIRIGFAMNDLEDELVGKWEKYYASRPEYMARIVERSNKYLFYIVTELERRNMPLEIALLPMIESAFNPIAHSTAKASGIWQFIPSTGTAFGMKQDWWADSRRDIVAATNGALDYLTKLNGMFGGDWQLALASYNWGEGSVGRASARSKASGRDGTYLTLNMPAETRNYLPKLQAVKNIIRNPAAFGLKIASIPNEPYFKTITLSSALDLKRAAQLAEMTEADFVALNPAHNRPVIAGRGEFQILLPADRADMFVSRLETDAKPKVSWKAYRTRAGDRIEALADRFGTSVAALKSVNGIRNASSSLPAGYHLLVPSDGPSADALGSIENAVFTKFPEYVAPRAHKVRKGETFAGIAKQYGVAPATLAKWNRMKKQSARAGQLLYVGGPAPVRMASKSARSSPKMVRASAKAGRSAPAKAKQSGKKAGKAVAARPTAKAKKRRA